MVAKRFLASGTLIAAALATPTQAAAGELSTTSAPAIVSSPGECTRSGGHTSGQGRCPRTRAEARAAMSGGGYQWDVRLRCHHGRDGPECFNPIACVDTEEGPGFEYDLYWKDEGASASQPWVYWGWSCLDGRNVVDPGKVRDEMREIEWEQADLIIQPPDGRTLVNFKTNFYTEIPATRTRTVEILGLDVAITVAVRDYVWHWGDGTDLTTQRPGAAWTKSRPEVDVFHEYLRPGDYRPSVDTVLTGTYTVEGDDQVHSIPGTHLVPGRPTTLEAVEAHSVLVG